MADLFSDRLDALLNHFPVRANMFHAGALCGTTDFAPEGGGGQLHLVRGGALEVIHPGHPALQISVPSLLLYPRPMARRFVSGREHGADLVCAQLQFDGGDANPLVSALPDIVCVPLATIAGAEPILTLLYAEAFGTNCGRHALIDRLFDIVLIQLLRQLMETGQVEGGMLAGLSHPKLRKSLVAMHERPGEEWSLDALAATSGMSRSVFAGAFHRVVGLTPGAYLQSWRVRLAQLALMQGKKLKMIAIEIGYGSEAALSRAFKAQCGITPREWRQLRLGTSKTSTIGA